MPPLAGFLGGTYRSRVHSLKLSRTVNLIPTLDESRMQDAIKAVGGFVRTPGLASFATGLGGPVRGMHVVDGRLFAVAGTTLWELDSAGMPTDRGTVVSDTRRAYLADNANGQLFVQVGATGYVLTLATHTLTVVTATAFQGAYGPCVFRDGYIVRVLADDNLWQYSHLNDASAWHGLNARSRTNDPLRGIAVTGTNIWLLGSEVTEARYNAGTSSVWAAVPHGLMGVGLEAAESLAMLGQIPYWLGRSAGGLMVCRGSGDATFERISTNALEDEWSSYAAADIAGATAYAYADSGAAFYVVSFGGAAHATFVYDARTGFWHEEGQFYASSGYQHVEGQCHAWFGGQHLLGSRRTGDVFAVDAASDTLTGSDTVRWMRLVPSQMAAHRRVFHRRVSLEMDNPASNPVSLRWSDDNGVAWSAGRSGVMDGHLAWKRLGQSRTGRLYEFSGSTHVRLTQAYLDALVEVT